MVALQRLDSDTVTEFGSSAALETLPVVEIAKIDQKAFAIDKDSSFVAFPLTNSFVDLD